MSSTAPKRRTAHAGWDWLEHSAQRTLLLDALARCFATATDTQGILRSCSHLFGQEWFWLPPVARRFVQQTDGKTRARHREIVTFLSEDPGVRRAFTRLSGRLQIRRRVGLEPQMCPVPAAADWAIPSIPHLGALADWLWLELGELDWFADRRSLANRHPLNHYTYQVLTKRSGGVRLIESPKQRLKAIQRQILTWILNPIPHHDAAHGFIKARSTRTFAQPHVAQAAVVRMDLQNFFPALRCARIQSFFRTAGYPESVADVLGALCTTVTPRDILPDRDARQLYGMPHLPQGAPTSPSLANLCAYRLDCRLSGLAARFEARYTRYADDLAFSGGQHFARAAAELPAYVGAILLEEGFTANFRKTRIMRPGVRQHLAGLVVNQALRVSRTDFDRLKATLINCERLGPSTQDRDRHANFRAHLEGRIGYVQSFDTTKGSRLRQIFERILWNE